jgi:hypothetical protein
MSTCPDHDTQAICSPVLPKGFHRSAAKVSSLRRASLFDVGKGLGRRGSSGWCGGE